MAHNEWIQKPDLNPEEFKREKAIALGQDRRDSTKFEGGIIDPQPRLLRKGELLFRFVNTFYPPDKSGQQKQIAPVNMAHGAWWNLSSDYYRLIRGNILKSSTWQNFLKDNPELANVNAINRNPSAFSRADKQKVLDAYQTAATRTASDQNAVPKRWSNLAALLEAVVREDIWVFAGIGRPVQEINGSLLGDSSQVIQLYIPGLSSRHKTNPADSEHRPKWTPSDLCRRVLEVRSIRFHTPLS